MKKLYVCNGVDLQRKLEQVEKLEQEGKSERRKPSENLTLVIYCT